MWFYYREIYSKYVDGMVNSVDADLRDSALFALTVLGHYAGYVVANMSPILFYMWQNSSQ